jgi:hypothetical protein
MVNKVEHYFYTVLGSKLMIKIFTLLREGSGFKNCRKCKTKKTKELYLSARTSKNHARRKKTSLDRACYWVFRVSSYW